MVSTRSTRTSSPTPSDSSEMYWQEIDNRTSVSPAPSQTADALGWDSDSSVAPMDSTNATPTPQTARPSTPASVVEISRDEFPPLEAPAPTTATKPRAKAAKDKGKKKAKVVTNDEDNPFLAADIVRATAASLGLTSTLDHATAGASSSRRPAAEPGSPSKRLRANTTGDAAPAPFANAATTTTNSTNAPVNANAAAPVTHTTATAAPAPTPDVTPAAAPVAATTTASVAPDHVAAPPTVDPAITYAAAAAIAPAAADVAALATDAAVPADDTALPPLWLTADGLPPRGSYTPTPAGGFPTIVYSPDQLLHGVPLELVRMYGEVAHPIFFMVVSGGNGAVMRTHGLIREAIGNFVNIDPAGFTLGTPPTAANGTSPALWLAADIPNNLAQAIVDSRIISSTAITLFPLPYTMPDIGFVGVFAGFTLPNTDAGANAARDLIRTAIAANNEIAQFVQTHRDAFGPQVSAEEAWATFLASVTVHGIVLLVNDTNTVAWHLHVNPSTNVRESWSQLRRLFGKLQIMTALYGTARLQRAFRCRICPFIDHPTPLCPLPGIPGWLGPTPATIAALEDASRAAATKAQEQMRLNAFNNGGGSGPSASNGRGQGPSNKKPRSDGKGKKGGDFKGKGKRRDDFF
ncbi:hypothetical protein FB451DRAFT_1400725 [Mycena latifolia]|nr:hypothetical protein FB451DRAFT_1400725 [Mycena latifolia]